MYTVFKPLLVVLMVWVKLKAQFEFGLCAFTMSGLKIMLKDLLINNRLEKWRIVQTIIFKRLVQ